MLDWGSDDEDDPLFGSSWRTGSLFGNVDLSGVLPHDDFADDSHSPRREEREKRYAASLPVPMGSNK